MIALEMATRSIVVFALEIAELAERIASRGDSAKTAAALREIGAAGQAVRACVLRLRMLAAR